MWVLRRAVRFKVYRRSIFVSEDTLSSKDRLLRATERDELKSLILAQIERWRHA